MSLESANVSAAASFTSVAATFAASLGGFLRSAATSSRAAFGSSA
ncbi:hypothetical protein WME94_00450 [Sorangium sp. So ce429]